MGAAAPIMELAGPALSIAGKLGEGRSKKIGYQLEAVKMQTAAEVGKTRALQVDAQYRDDLNHTLANISAIRSAQGASIDSPTSRALFDKADEMSMRGRVTAVSNEKIKALTAEGDALTLQRLSSQALSAAWAGAAPDILKLANTAGNLAMKAFDPAGAAAGAAGNTGWASPSQRA